MDYDKYAEEMTIVVALLLFLFKFDDSRIFYKNIFIKEWYNEREESHEHEAS